jgi:predicted SAM-dependent methyltransferase
MTCSHRLNSLRPGAVRLLRVSQGAAQDFPDASLGLVDSAVDQFLSYLEHDDSSADPDEPVARRVLKRLVPPAARAPLRTVMTAAARPLATRRIERFGRRQPLKLHLGSGSVYKAGWVNIDLLPVKVDVPWNLANGIPFPDASVDAIMHEHLQEHLTLREGYELARESRRVLKRGGILRVGVPDAGQAVQSYAGNWSDEWARSAPTGMIAIQRLFYRNGHRAMYDGQTLILLLRAAGFANVRRHAIGEGRLQPNEDSPHRGEGTLYVEAVKT